MQLSDTYKTALNFAFTAHREQLRKGSGIPYISHLLSVSALIMEFGGTEEQAIAGLLHDAVEDQGGTPMLAEIHNLFGETVAGIVDEYSDTDVEPKPPWRQRKIDYIEAIAHKSEETLLVSMADKLHNLRSIYSDYLEVGEELWKRFKGGKDGTLWYYRELIAAFKKRSSSAILKELEETFKRLDSAVAHQAGASN